MPESPGAGHRTGAVAAAGPTTRSDDTVRGIALMGLAYIVISGGDAAVKWALPEVGTAVAMIWRGIVGAGCVALIVRGRGLFPRNRRLLLARSLLHTGVSAAWYWAWERGMPLADSYAVACATPLLMTLFAIPMLGEQVGWRRWTSTLLGFAGVLVLQPSGDLWRFETPVMLAAVVVMAVTRIWTRVLARTDTPAAIAFWLIAAHVPVGLALLPAFPPPSGTLVPPGLGVALALIGFGAVNAGAHILFGRAFALAPVSVLAPYEYTPLLWGAALGFLIWAEVPSWTTLAGAAIVVAAGIYNLHRERVRRRMERHAPR